MSADLYEQISHLAERAVTRFLDLAGNEADDVNLYCTEPAAQWVTRGAVTGRSLPVNLATLQALTVAVAELEGVVAGPASA